MTAAILTIGTELTRGELADSNAVWLSEQLTALGFAVVEHRTVDDDEGRIVGALRDLGDRADIVISTGGLGPTSDDLTAACVAKALGVPLVRDAASLERMRQRYESTGRKMPPVNAKQADVPDGAEVLPNPIGTAPGFAVKVGRARMFFLPGVPVEMQRLLIEEVTPRIARDVTRDTHQEHLRCFGMTESQIAERLADLEQEKDVVFAYRAHFPEIEVKVLAKAATEAEAETRARDVAQRARERLGDVVYGGRDDTFAAAVGRALRHRGLTLAVAESCTGGIVGAMLTDVPGSSDYVLFDAVTYANSSKTKVLGVSPELLRAHGAVSEEVAAAMAEGALRVGGSDLAVAVTGIAGPGGGSDQKPVGTVFLALAQKERPTITRRQTFPGDRARIRTLAAYLALRMVLQATNGGIRE